MVRTKDELLEKIRAQLGDEPSDEQLGFLEDFTDTFTDLESKSVKNNADGKDWEKEYHELDKTWKKRYTDRFFNPQANADLNIEPDPDPEQEEPTKTEFSELFE